MLGTFAEWFVGKFDKQEIEILNWEKFNPRKDVRHSSWFRMNHSIFEEPKFYELEPPEWAVLIYLFCHASKVNFGVFTLNYEHASRVAKFSAKLIDSTIEKLLQSQFLTVHVTRTNADVTSTNAHVTSRWHTYERTNVRNGDFDFELIYKIYPLKKGKAKGFISCQKQIKLAADYDALKRAVENYAADCAANKTEPKFIKHFSTFMGSAEVQPWRDWIDHVPKSADTKPKLKFVTAEEVLRGSA